MNGQRSERLFMNLNLEWEAPSLELSKQIKNSDL